MGPCYYMGFSVPFNILPHERKRVDVEVAI
jgi:hypothetical protein